MGTEGKAEPLTLEMRHDVPDGVVRVSPETFRLIRRAREAHGEWLHLVRAGETRHSLPPERCAELGHCRHIGHGIANHPCCHCGERA